MIKYVFEFSLFFNNRKNCLQLFKVWLRQQVAQVAEEDTLEEYSGNVLASNIVKLAFTICSHSGRHDAQEDEKHNANLWPSSLLKHENNHGQLHKLENTVVVDKQKPVKSFKISGLLEVPWSQHKPEILYYGADVKLIYVLCSFREE